MVLDRAMNLFSFAVCCCCRLSSLDLEPGTGDEAGSHLYSLHRPMQPDVEVGVRLLTFYKSIN